MDTKTRQNLLQIYVLVTKIKSLVSASHWLPDHKEKIYRYSESIQELSNTEIQHVQPASLLSTAEIRAHYEALVGPSGGRIRLEMLQRLRGTAFEEHYQIDDKEVPPLMTAKDFIDSMVQFIRAGNIVTGSYILREAREAGITGPQARISVQEILRQARKG